MLASLLCSHQAVLLLMQAMALRGCSRDGLYASAFLNSCFAATSALSLKDKHDSLWSWTLQWDGMEMRGLGQEGAPGSPHKHVWGCAHTGTYKLPSKTCAVPCHRPRSAAFHKSNLLQSSVQRWEIFNRVWWTSELLFHGGHSNFIQTPFLRQILLMMLLQNTPIRMQLRKVDDNGH